MLRGNDQRINFLNNLNGILKEKEKEIVNKAMIALKTMEEKKLHDKFIKDYEVEAKVEYYLCLEDDPAHTYWTHFNYSSFFIENDYGLLLSNFDWRTEDYMPILNEPYCYLLHDLIDHARLNDKLYEIKTIWVEIVVTEQNFIDL